VVAEGAIDADPIDPPLFLPEEYGFLTTKTVRWTNGQLLQPGPAKLSIGITSPDEPDFYNQADDDAVDDCYLFPPKAKRQCKGKGWRRWAFESRKECTAYVEQQARKACLDEREAGPAEFRDKYGSGKHHRHALRNCIREST
jgi:hypothetical protein